MPWDARTTDLWVHLLDSQYGSPVRSWNILQGDIPQLQTGSYMRVDCRLRNFGSTSINVRLALQTVSTSDPSTRFGLVIYDDPQTITPGNEAVFYHWVQMWAENVYERLWVDNVLGIGGNCGPNISPPYSDSCREGELYDSALSSRHLVTVLNTGGGQGGQNFNWLIPVSIGVFVVVILGAEIVRRKR